jgi:methionyl-tRNA synthetase
MKFYVTTPIYYVSAAPHIGTCYTTIAADCLARYHRMKDDDVFFLTGSDEHGEKMVLAAEKNGLTPAEFTDRMVAIYKETWQRLNISYDRFIRTTENEHQRVVQHVFRTLLEKGDIFLGDYTGYYCIPCERFIPRTELGEGSPTCPDCGRPVGSISEKSYFFKLSKYQQQIQKFIEQNREFVQPPFRFDEVYNFVTQGLTDLSITRRSVRWGIPSPTPEKYPVYVWFDALINYLAGVGYPLDRQFVKYWPPDIQLLGKDILRFHAIIWIAILFALGLEPPRQIFAHGWWVMDKEKISKSKGNVVDPLQLCATYGVDGFRYFLLREVPFGLDGEYSEEKFVKRYNSDLANDLGNLVNRTLNLFEKLFANRVQAISISTQMEEMIESSARAYHLHMEKAAFSLAVEEVWKIVTFLNRMLDREKPWNAPRKNAEDILGQCLYGIKAVSIMLCPFMPESAQKIWSMLNLPYTTQTVRFSLLKQPPVPGTQLQERSILFQRIKR